MKKTNPDDSLAESFATAYSYAWNCLFIYANQWIPFLFKPASISFLLLDLKINIVYNFFFFYLLAYTSWSPMLRSSKIWYNNPHFRKEENKVFQPIRSRVMTKVTAFWPQAQISNFPTMQSTGLMPRVCVISQSLHWYSLSCGCYRLIDW